MPRIDDAMREQLQNLDDDETTVEFRDSTLPLSDTLRAMACLLYTSRCV